MIHPKSLFRVSLATLDAFFGLGLLAFSWSVYGGSPVLMVIGLLFFVTGSRVLAYLRLRAFLVSIGALSTAMAYAAVRAGMPPHDVVPLVAALDGILALNVVYAFRLRAPRP